jgi:hypothetical protein
MKYVLLVLLLFLTSCASSIQQEQKEDLRLQQEVIRQLNSENEQLREVNGNLRRMVVALHENGSATLAMAELCMSQCPSFTQTTDLPSPKARVPIDDILINPQNIIITIPDIQYGIVAASKSMDPLLDENDVLLEIDPSDESEINTGDIIIYERGSERIVHRVIDISHDNAGWYAITKGDNNLWPDKEKVRFDNILGVVVGIIY